MTLDEARKILRLKPDEDPRRHLADFQKARDSIAAMIRTAPDPAASGRFMKGLIEFDEALAVVKKFMAPDPESEAVMGPGQPISIGKKIEPVALPPSKTPYIAWFAAVFLIAVAVMWMIIGRSQKVDDQQLQTRLQALDQEGSALIGNRRWDEARSRFAEIEKLSPGSDLARQGQLRIETGMTEEQTQFIGYWTGQATAELEAGRLDEAEASARKVLEKYPTERDASTILKDVATARESQSRNAALAAVRQSLDQRQWDAALTSIRKILVDSPNDPEAVALFNDAKNGAERAAANERKGLELLKMALARDTGEFDQQSLDWLREAKSLAPDNAEIATQLEKQASYTRTIRVPGDFSTPAEALAQARERDRIVLAAGDWKGPLVIDAAVQLEGAGAATTRIECPPGEGCAITVGPGAKGARISGITFRHETFAIGDERFSAALVRGGEATFADCKFTEASGHGLAVIEGGRAIAARSRFSGNGWDGIAAIGQGTTLEVRDCESLENYQHGIESWEGASLVVVKNRCQGNSRNGIHADSGTASVTLEGNQLLDNREFGLVLDSAGAGSVTTNTASANHLGGIVVRASASKVALGSNQITLNKGPGLVLENGLPSAAYATNSVSRNTGGEILANNDLSVQAVESAKPDAPARVAVPVPVAPAPPAVYPRAKIIEEP